MIWNDHEGNPFADPPLRHHSERDSRQAAYAEMRRVKESGLAARVHGVLAVTQTALESDGTSNTLNRREIDQWTYLEPVASNVGRGLSPREPEDF